MKKNIFTLIAIVISVFSASAQYNYGSTYGSSNYGSSSYGVNSNSTYVNGYTRSNGTYVQGHRRSSRNTTNHDNYSTSGNTKRPKTGSGQKDQFRNYSANRMNEIMEK